MVSLPVLNLKLSVISLSMITLSWTVVRPTAAQTDAPSPTTPTTDTASPGAGRAIAFSAIRYSRTVRVMPDGKLKFLRHNRYPAVWARDSEGRVKFQRRSFYGECDRPTEEVAPKCFSWGEQIFDPVEQTIVSWPGGPGGAHITGISRLTPAEVNELIQIPSGFRVPEPTQDDEATNVTTVNLGTKDIDGVEATGVRTTSIYPPGYSGNKLPIARIHEVWTSPDLNMVVRVIDGDPTGEETISGLEKISMQPDPALFQAPEDNSIQALSPNVKPTYIRYFAEFFAD
jgi:hypothetical protein